MTIFATLSRLLLALALCGMLSAPFARSAMAMPVPAQEMEAQHDASMASMGEMPCCPETTPAGDCAKTCALMAMCATQFMHVAPFAALNVTMTLAARIAPASDVPLASLESIPRPKPPKFFA